MISLKSKNWQIDNIDTILFDKDGTFIDLHYFWGKMSELRVEKIIEKYQLDKSYFSQLCLCLGYDISSLKMLKNGITALYSRNKIIEIFKNDLKNIGLILSTKELEQIFDEVSYKFYKNMHNYTKPIESAISFIKKIKKLNIKTGIVTSDSVESTNLTLKHFGWEELFDIVLGRESTKENKESGAPAKLAIEKLKTKPKNVLMIGDAPMDYICAKNAQIDNILLVSTGQVDEKELLLTSNLVVSSLDLIEIIK